MPPGYGPVDDLVDIGNMIEVPAGELHTGTVTTSMYSFYLDRTEVTVARYRECVRTGACRAPRPDPPWMNDDLGCDRDLGSWAKSTEEDHPITCVEAADAYAYCVYAGKRLPTAREWTYAARGQDKRTYPWGDQKPSCKDIAVRKLDLVSCNAAGTRAVGVTKLDASAFGVLDMGGNVAEFVLEHARQAPQPGERTWATMGGGIAGFDSQIAIDDARAAARTSRGVGFRCAFGGKPY